LSRIKCLISNQRILSTNNMGVENNWKFLVKVIVKEIIYY